MGPKKAKKTKAELEEERLAREEEERKAKILEEKKNAEEAEKRRIEQLRVEAEHKNQRELELQRLAAEYEEILDDEKSKELQLAAEEKKENAKLEWARYIDPSDEADVSVEKDMNTFIALTKDTFVEDLKPTMALIKRIELLAIDVENVWSESLATRNNVARSKALQNLITLREIIYEKLDIATMKVLAFSDEQLNDRSEMNIEATAHRLSVGLWASFADVRPIRKSVIFESIGIQFDLQKQVLQQHDNYVFRVIRMPIVAYNLQAYDIDPETIANILASLEPSSNITNLNEKEAEEEQGQGSVTEENEEVSGSRAITPKASPRPLSTTDSTLKLPSKYIVGDLILFDVLYAPPPAYHLRIRKWTMRDKSTSATKLRKSVYPSSVPSRMQLKIPETVLMTDDMRIAVWNDDQKDWIEDSISDYQYNELTRTVTFYITTVGIIALVKKRTVDLPYKKWNLAPVLYKPINALIAAKLKVSDPSDLKAPTLVNPTQSVEEGEEEVKSNHSSRSDLHTTTSASALTKSHSVESSSTHYFERYARFTVNTQQNIEIVIDIAGPLCILVKPVSPVFADMLNEPMNPATLLRRLLRKGVNIMPNPADLAFADRITSKNAVLEDNVLLQIAKASSAFEFTSSSWNQSLNTSQSGILIRESNVYTCFPQLNEYDCILVEMDEISISYKNTPELGYSPGPGGLRYLLVNGNEYGNRKVFSHVPRPNEIVHLEISKNLTKRATLEALERMQNINQRFQKTVHTLLYLVKPLSLG